MNVIVLDDDDDDNDDDEAVQVVSSGNDVQDVRPPSLPPSQLASLVLPSSASSDLSRVSDGGVLYMSPSPSPPPPSSLLRGARSSVDAAAGSRRRVRSPSPLHPISVGFISPLKRRPSSKRARVSPPSSPPPLSATQPGPSPSPEPTPLARSASRRRENDAELTATLLVELDGAPAPGLVEALQKCVATLHFTLTATRRPGQAGAVHVRLPEAGRDPKGAVTEVIYVCWSAPRLLRFLASTSTAAEEDSLLAQRIGLDTRARVVMLFHGVGDCLQKLGQKATTTAAAGRRKPNKGKTTWSGEDTGHWEWLLTWMTSAPAGAVAALDHLRRRMHRVILALEHELHIHVMHTTAVEDSVAIVLKGALLSARRAQHPPQQLWLEGVPVKTLGLSRGDSVTINHSLFRAVLLQVPGLGDNAVDSIVASYGSFAELMQALRQPGGQEALAAVSAGGKRVGPVLAGALATLATTTSDQALLFPSAP